MRIKRLYLLLIFVFSILMTNLHISNMKPSLTYEKTPNLITLVDNVRGSQVSLIALDLSDHDHSFVVSDIDKDNNPISVLNTKSIYNKFTYF